jgi:2-polyprenyl-3-methyl-5-hydroxy-6-metoxy-1,4-benzoquinol methylase
MLEVGAASGAFLHRMARAGWEVEGIEPAGSASRAARALGYAVHEGTMETAPDPARPYDLVVAWMALEHLHDPVRALRSLRDWTVPDGRLVLSVPNAASWERRLFGEDWYALQLPTHLYHFTPRTLALERGGWRLDRIFHQRVISNLVGSLGHALERRRVAPALAERLSAFPDRGGRAHYLLFPLAAVLAAFGQTGRMTVWARRLP